MTREEAINRLTNTLQEMRAFFFDSKHISEDDEKDLASMEMAIKALEHEQKTGHWVKYGIPRCGEQHYKCTSCGYYINFGQWGELYSKEFKYCPNCGCRMVGDAE